MPANRSKKSRNGPITPSTSVSRRLAARSVSLGGSRAATVATLQGLPRDEALQRLSKDGWTCSGATPAIRAGHAPDFPEDRVQSEIHEIESLAREGESGFALSPASVALVLFLLGAGALWAWLV